MPRNVLLPCSGSSPCLGIYYSPAFSNQIKLKFIFYFTATVKTVKHRNVMSCPIIVVQILRNRTSNVKAND